MVEKMGYEKDRRIHRKYGNRPEICRVGDNTCHFRSQLELKWAKYLQWLLENGKILSWEYEPYRFQFEGETSGARDYLPDFSVVENDGTVVRQECKGHHDGKMNTRFRRMAKHFPDVVMELVSGRFDKKNAQRRSVAAKYCRRVIDASQIFKQMKGLI